MIGWMFYFITVVTQAFLGVFAFKFMRAWLECMSMCRCNMCLHVSMIGFVCASRWMYIRHVCVACF